MYNAYGDYGYLGLGIDVPYVKFGTTSGVGHPVADNSGTCGDAFAVQQMLKDLGFYGAAIDGMFGTGTFKAIRLFAEANGVPYVSGTFPKTDVCQALINAWQAQMAPAAPAAPPPAAAPPPTTVAPKPAPSLISMIQLAPALQRIRLTRPTTTTRAAALAPAPTGTMDRIKRWWGSASTVQKLAVVGGGVAIVGGVLYLIMPKTATANPRRRRKHGPRYAKLCVCEKMVVNPRRAPRHNKQRRRPRT
jgi:hypothetical protein